MWRAFSAPDQRAICDLHELPPVVQDAVARLMQEFPWTTDGLNRSRRSLLQGGGTKEERPFLGDTIAFDYLDGRVHPRAARYDPAKKRLV